MKGKRIPSYLLCISVFAVLMGCKDAGGEILWRNDPEGRKEASVSGKTLLISFYADWCGYCKKMDATTFRDRQVVAYVEKYFVPVKVDSDKEKQLAASYFVRGLPTTVFAKPSGEPISSLPGYVEPEHFLLAMQFIQTKGYEKMSFQEFVKQQAGEQRGR